MSSIGLGCVTFGREIDRDTSFDVLDRARQCGINLLDTAAVYGGGASETVLGQWLLERAARDEVVLATKVSKPLDRQSVCRSVEESLRRLRTDHVDLLQAHQWDEQTPLDETLEAFDTLIRQGKVRHAGCSNWTAGQLNAAIASAKRQGWDRLESVQPPYNLAQREIEEDLLPFCTQRRLGVLAYSPLGAGFLTGKYRRGEDVPRGTRFDVIAGHQRIYFTEDGFRIAEGLRQLAGRTGSTMTQLALAWIVGRPSVTSVLIGCRHVDHVEQALAAQQASLTAELRKRLEHL